MRIGLQIPSFTWPGGTPELGSRLAGIARAAEAAGFSSLWVMDHYFQIRGVGAVDEPMLEAYTTLGALAGLTTKPTLGTMVAGVIYREPALLVKAATTLDVLSGGRAYLGIGAAWFEREALGLGFPFPSMKERFERLEEALQIAHLMWSGEAQAFEGKHYRLEETLTVPQPVTRPHPPILVGGGGERKTLRLVAQYADACNLFARQGLDVVRHKIDVLRRHCDDLGRDFGEIEVTTLSTARLGPGGMTPDDVVRFCGELAGLGVHHAIFNMPNVSEIEPLQVFGERVIPEVRGY